ncbi:MAG TPA: DegV family protein [Bacillales bacterium]|nr:DegV family protein [Bacillales bacterium]
MTVKIVTDSSADIPKSLAVEYGIEIVPLVVMIGEDEYYDGETITPDTLYQKMKDGQVPKTAQVPYERIRKVFENLAKNNESAVYIGLSSELSGTYQTATLVRDELIEEYKGFDLETVDSKGASIGQGFIALEAARMAKEGRSKEKILEAVRFNIAHMDYIFTVDDLEYLKRGGRIGRAAAFLGGLLNIKPLLGLEDGRLVPIEKVRGQKKVFRRMIEILKERVGDLDKQTIGLCYADALDSVETLKKMIQDELGGGSFLEVPIGAVIGSHAGPGTFAVVFRKAVYKED